MDKLGTFDTFVRVSETKSFTEAGIQLGISASAVGKSIARLEERLNVRLFHRSTRSMTLTSEGAIFLESCRRIFSEIEQAERRLAQIKGAPRGKLRVSLPFVESLMMPTLSKFKVLYPDIELDLDFSNRLVNIIDDGFDIAIRTGVVQDSRLSARTLGSYRLIIVGSPVYFAKAGIPVHPRELMAHRCLHHKIPSTGKLVSWALIPDSLGEEYTLPTTMACNTIDPLIYMAEEGHGLASVPDFAVRAQLDEGRLVQVLHDYVESLGTFHAVWPSSQYLNPKLRVFIDFLRENLFIK